MKKIQFNQKGFDYLVGDRPKISFEQRIFNILNLLGAFAILLGAGLGYFIWDDLVFALIILAFSILSFLAYYTSRFRNKYQLGQSIFYVYVHFLFLILWIKGGGIESNFLLLLFNIGLWLLLFSVKRFYSKVIFNFLFVIVLVLINLWHPNLIQWIPETNFQKGFSQIGSYIIIGIYTYSIVFLFIKRFKQERASLQEANEKLNVLNQILVENKKELEKSNALRNKLFSVISHDMRSLVGIVNNFSELLIDPDMSIGDEDEYEIKNNIHDASNNLLAMVDNLLYWARIQMNAISIKKQNVPIKNVIQSCIRIYKHNIEDKGIELVSYYNQPCIVNVDLEMLRFIIRNLLSNAIKFSNSNGEIQITLENYQENQIRFSVIDNGVGMTKDELVAIKDTTTHFTTLGTQNEQGTGLGLVIVHDFAKSLGGSIEIESEKGKGSRFSLILPKQ